MTPLYIKKRNLLLFMEYDEEEEKGEQRLQLKEDEPKKAICGIETRGLFIFIVFSSYKL